ncbi:MAG: adenosylcobinamide-GDP ribazoletransferase [bacterium]
MKNKIPGLLIAFQFLTIIPVKVKGDVGEDDIAGSSVFFPLVGAFQGLIVVLSALLLIKVFNVEVVSVLIILILIITNKGLHLDGLADTFDALGVAPTGNATSDIEKRLSAMKDSRIGAIGAISIVFTILIKFALLNALWNAGTSFNIYMLLFLMPVFSKWTMVPALYHGTSARQDGIGRVFIEHTSLARLAVATIITMSLAGVSLYIYSFLNHDLLNGLMLFGTLFLVLYLFSVISIRFFKKRFNGITGDTLGAISELSEVLFLFVVVLWLKH